MKLKPLFSLLLLPLLLLSGCSKSDPISAVKEGVLEVDKGTTVGKAFDNYKYFKKASWSVLKTDNGRTLVEVCGMIDFDKVPDQEFADSILEAQGLSKDQFDANEMTKALAKIKKDIKKMIKGSELVVQFKLNEDDTFELYAMASHGVKLNGENTPDTAFNEEMQNKTLKDVYEEHLPVTITALILAADASMEEEK